MLYLKFFVGLHTFTNILVYWTLALLPLAEFNVREPSDLVENHFILCILDFAAGLGKNFFHSRRIWPRVIDIIRPITSRVVPKRILVPVHPQVLQGLEQEELLSIPNSIQLWCVTLFFPILVPHLRIPFPNARSLKGWYIPGRRISRVDGNGERASCFTNEKLVLRRGIEVDIRGDHSQVMAYPLTILDERMFRICQRKVGRNEEDTSIILRMRSICVVGWL